MLEWAPQLSGLPERTVQLTGLPRWAPQPAALAGMLERTAQLSGLPRVDGTAAGAGATALGAALEDAAGLGAAREEAAGLGAAPEEAACLGALPGRKPQVSYGLVLVYGHHMISRAPGITY